MKEIIDCHAHFLTKEDFYLYKKTAVANKFINIRGVNIEEMLKPFEFSEFENINNMYFLDSANLKTVDESIEWIKKDLNTYKNIVGIKMYLGYQKFYANDDRVKKIVKFAATHNLTVTFHCGEILDENDKSVFSPYSDAKYIEELATMYPNTNFIASHLNWPNFNDVFRLCNDYNNVYTCLSGTNDGETAEKRKQQNLYIASRVNEYLFRFPKLKKKIMYGTDFFASSDEYNDVSSYKDLVEMLNVTEKEKEDIYSNNAKRAYKI